MTDHMTTAPRSMILVLGMHRSGTSAVAGTLAQLGVDFSEHLVAPAEDNPKGFFEHEQVWLQDHEILQTLGSAWDDPLPLPPDWQSDPVLGPASASMQEMLQRDFGAASMAAIKDPRMCRLLPPWLDWLARAEFEPKILLALRRPAEVVASLAKRDQLSPDQAGWIWLRHVLESERASRNLTRTVTRYENMLSDWRTELGRIADRLGVVWPDTSPASAAAVDAFLEPGLRHNRDAAMPKALSQPLRGWIERAYAALADDTSLIDVDALDRVGAEIDAVDRAAEASAVVLRAARLQRHRLQDDLASSDRERVSLIEGNAALEENLDRHAEELAKSREGAAALRENLDRHAEELAKSQEGAAALRENLDRHVEELAKSRSGSAVLQENLDRHVEELAATRAGNTGLEANLQRHVEALAEIKTGNDWLQSQLEQSAQEVAQGVEELAQRDEELVRQRAVFENLWREREALAEARDNFQTQLAEVYASRSWRITRPMRGAIRVARRALHRQPPVAPSPPGPASARAEAHTANAPIAAQPAAPQPWQILEAAWEKTSGPRVLIVTPDIQGPIRNGGIGTAFTALAKTLAEAGHAVTILYTLGGHSEDGNGVGQWENHYASLGIRFIPVWLEQGEPVLDAPHHAWRAYRVYLWLKERQGDYDLAYFPEWKGEAYYALQSKRLGLDFERLRIMVVTHSSTTWAESGNYVVPQQFDDLLLEFLERRSTEMADAVISPSQYMVDWMRGRGWTWSAPTYVIQNLMSDALPETAAAAPAFAVTEWVFFGRLERRKGLLVFLGALRRMPPEVRERIQIAFLGKSVGTRHFDSNAEIHQQLAEWGVPVKIIDSYDREQALAYLREPGRVAVIASLVENSPYTVLECVLQRIPFVAADVGGIAELIHPDDRDRALFKPTPAGLADRLSALKDGSYTPPRPASAAAKTREQWLALQQQLLTDIPGHFPPPRADEPHISVCLVHYNRPAMLALAIDSLRRQTYRRFDVVLVDDGSPSAEAQQYLDSLEDEFAWRGWSIVRQDNAYLGAARNNAARHAEGDYVMFMDDDNLAKPEELATFAHAVAASDADILTTVSDVFSDTESGPQPPQASRQLWIPLGNAAGLGVFRNVFGDANALIRRSMFERVGGFTEDYGIGHEDWELFARASIAGADLQLVPEPLFWYRVNATSMLRAGHADTDYARSVRPYWEGFGHGVGPVLAYASHLQRQPQTVGHETASPASADSMPPQGPRQRALIALSGAFRPELRARLMQVVRESGWRGAAGRVRRYLGRRS